MSNQSKLILGVSIFAIFVLLNSMYIVDMRQQVFITQFGKPVGKATTNAGLHFKIPFIQKVESFDKRFLEWDGNPNDVTTKDKQMFSIDTYARWRIADPLQFFKSVYNELGAQTRLDGILDGAARDVVAQNDLVNLIRSIDREAVMDSELSKADQSTNELVPFENGRRALENEVINRAKPTLASLGIELLDFRFKRLNYSNEVKQEILNRMIAERNRISDKYRSEGQGEAAKIIGQKEKELKQIASESYRQVQEIRGQADAEAVKIFADAYNSSQEARDFYEFKKTMEAYEKSISKNDTLIISTDSDFYKYLSNADVEKTK